MVNHHSFASSCRLRPLSRQLDEDYVLSSDMRQLGNKYASRQRNGSLLDNFESSTQELLSRSFHSQQSNLRVSTAPRAGITSTRRPSNVDISNNTKGLVSQH